MCQASTCGRVLARARVQVLQNSASRMVVLRFTTLSARDCHWRNPRKINYREHSNIKSARVRALTCQAKWPRRCRWFQHSSGIEPMSPDSLRPVLITKPLVRINYLKKTSYFATSNWFFRYRTVVPGFFKLNIKARHEIIVEIREFLNASLWSIHLIAFDID